MRVQKSKPRHYSYVVSNGRTYKSRQQASRNGLTGCVVRRTERSTEL